ncbi:MAG TPA: helix-turn-helix domain-containing protein [Candidatus Limnocylindria bacterium]|nr:helix-turn-helix domain-containing protein [Candidatus Limnocylindria bacterium]
MAGLTPFIDILPSLCQTAAVLDDVVVLALPGVAPFELGVVCEVFGIDRSDSGLPTYDFAVVGLEAGRAVPVGYNGGLSVTPSHGLRRVEQADLIAVPAHSVHASPAPEVLDALRRAEARGAWVLSLCSGAFTLGAAGLLDGRTCTTHWMHAESLARAFPAADVRPDVLYVEDRRVVTSAGTSAGIDACLHLVRTEQGATVSNAVARRMVVPPHREGGQAQFIPFAVPDLGSESLAPLLDWAMARLGDDLTVEQMAAQAVQSPRTFARRFRAETGTTPYAWLTAQRVARAQELLETTDESIEWIAAQCGFGTAAVLRHHFAKAGVMSPATYRRAFRGTA